MAQADATLDLPVSPDRIWEVIGGFGSLPDWVSDISHSELSEGGRVRRLTGAGGVIIVERLIAFDQLGRSYSYTILESPMPVTGYLSTLQVKENSRGHGSRVEWSGRFTPSGVSKEEAATIFRRIYEDGLKALADKFAHTI